MSSMSFNSSAGFERLLGINKRGKIVSNQVLREILYEGLVSLWQAGIAQFVITAVSVLPVETGMTVATFTKAAELSDSAEAFRAIQQRYGAASHTWRPDYPRLNKDGDFMNTTSPKGNRRSVRGSPRDIATGIRLSRRRARAGFGSVRRFIFGFSFTYAVGQHKAADLGLWKNMLPARNSLDRGRRAMFDFILEGERALDSAVEAWLRTGDERVLAERLFRISKGNFNG